MSNVNNHLATRLRELRGERSLYKVEEGSGIPRSMLKRYESGENLPEDSTLQKLSTFYDVDYAELKTLYFEDFFPVDSVNRAILFQWVDKARAELSP
jgi:transcriptional regulator with XRE-family HTH domain